LIHRLFWCWCKKLSLVKSDSFDTDFFLKLHKEMFGDVWDWAGKIRTAELNFGVNAYLVSTELKKLTDDLSFWHENKTFRHAS
jgi:fido (protein-threonine AMPylation protein)